MPARAWIDAPYNGGFDGSADGWTQPWTPDAVCEYDGSMGYGANGSLKFGDPGLGYSCAYDSLAVHATGSWTLRVVHRGSKTTVCGMMVELIAVANPNQVVVLWTGLYSQANVWFQTDFQLMPSGSHYIRLRPPVSDGCVVHIDDVQAIGASGSNQSGTPTPGPTSTAIPTATRTPTATPVHTAIPGSSSQALVSMGTPTAYFNPSFYANPVIPVNLSGNTNPQVAIVEMEQRAFSFCLPDEIEQVISGVDLCVSIPLVSVTELSFAGIDLMPMLSVAASILFITFIVSTVRNR